MPLEKHTLIVRGNDKMVALMKENESTKSTMIAVAVMGPSKTVVVSAWGKQGFEEQSFTIFDHRPMLDFIVQKTGYRLQYVGVGMNYFLEYLEAMELLGNTKTRHMKVEYWKEEDDV